MKKTNIRRKTWVTAIVFLLVSAWAGAQDAPQNGFTVAFQAGIAFYGESRWTDAIAKFHEARDAAVDIEDKAEAVYWLCIAEEAAGEYDLALMHLGDLGRMSGGGIRAAARRAEVPYLRGRSLYALGQYNDAVVLLKNYADSLSDEGAENIAKKTAALYWAGESLFAMGQFNKAQDVFSLIVRRYPQSVKYEASLYRAALINQKKIEAELLSLLKQTNEESLKTIEEYQRRERVHTQTILAYERRIAALEARQSAEETAPTADVSTGGGN